MESTVLTVFLPAALAVIMLGLGLSLTLADFRRVLLYPGAVAAGLVIQLLVLPAASFGIAHAFGLPPELAVGLVLLAATPSGATSTLFTHLARGDTALCLTFAALTSLISVVVLPLLVNLAVDVFLGEGRAIPLQIGKTLQVFAVVLLPVGIGMVIRRFRPVVAQRLDRPVRLLSALFLVAVIALAVYQERANIGSYVAQAGLAVLAFNVLTLVLGYAAALLFRAGRPQALAVAMALGVRNGTLAIAVAGSPALLNSMAMAVAPAVYSLLMLLTAAALGFWTRRGGARETAPRQ